jgi:hypothetical protein
MRLRNGLEMAGSLLVACVLGSAASDAWAETRFDRVPALSMRSWDVYVGAGEQKTAVVLGDGDTVLDLYVYDSNTNLVDSTACLAGSCVVSWTTKWSSHFTVTVFNRGLVYNDYWLRVD